MTRNETAQEMTADHGPDMPRPTQQAPRTAGAPNDRNPCVRSGRGKRDRGRGHPAQAFPSRQTRPGDVIGCTKAGYAPGCPGAASNRATLSAPGSNASHARTFRSRPIFKRPKRHLSNALATTMSGRSSGTTARRVINMSVRLHSGHCARDGVAALPRT